MAKPYKLIRDTMSTESQQRAKKKAEKMLHEIRLTELREAVNLTQTQIAEKMGISQAAVSRLEKGGRDVYLSTLARFVASTGGELELSARYPDRDEVKLKIDVS